MTDRTYIPAAIVDRLLALLQHDRARHVLAAITQPNNDTAAVELLRILPAHLVPPMLALRGAYQQMPDVVEATPKPERGQVNERQPLSGREMQVAQLVAEGHGNKAIAAELALTEDTIKTHLAKISGKLGVDNRTQVAVWVAVNGNLRTTDEP